MFGIFRKKKQQTPPKYQPSPHLKVRAGFFSQDSQRLLSGWETTSYSIDKYLHEELTQLRARSRRMVRMNAYGKRFVGLMKSNVVGPDGVTISANRTQLNGKPDKRANDAVEKAFKDWAKKHCDYTGKSSFVELQNMAIACASQDGEFLFEKMQAGKYGFQLRAIDPELLDIDKHEQTRTGEIRNGIEYDAEGKVIFFHFKDRNSLGDYSAFRTYRIAASRIIHGFIAQFPDQSRGIPWMHAGLEEAKHLEKYQEGAIVNARASANTFNVLKDRDDGGDDEYYGDEPLSDDVSIDNIEPGATIDIGSKEIESVDPNYPHQMYADFVKANLRTIASGFEISYSSLANDLEGVNFSSIRAGTLEDREIFKGLQNWFIRVFVEPVFVEWVGMAYLTEKITFPSGQPVRGPLESYEAATYQGRRWAWVDPQKDMNANKMYIDERLKSRSQIMREQGDDPEAVWAEIAKEEAMMEQLGIQPIRKEMQQTQEASEDPSDE